MSNCPNCGASLHMQKPFWPFSLFIEKKFICTICDWQMSFEEVNRRGGLFAITHQKIHGIGPERRNNHKHSHKKHRHRGHRH